MSRKISASRIDGVQPSFSRRNFLAAAGAIGASIALGRHGDGQTAKLVAPFNAIFSDGKIVSLKFANDKFDTDYIASGRQIGDIFLQYRRPAADWTVFDTAQVTAPGIVTQNEDETVHRAAYRSADDLNVEVTFTIKGSSLFWKVDILNLTSGAVEIGDLAIPLPMNTRFEEGKPATSSVLKHSFISGHSSFLFWMRSNSVGPFLTLTPVGDTFLEYWDTKAGYRAFVHSAASGSVAHANGCRWRQPNTSATLPGGGTLSYEFRFDWADDYDGVRQLLVDNGLLDCHVVPGMTLPSDLTAHFALRTKQKILAVEAEFPDHTTITFLGSSGQFERYSVQFNQLGENRLVVRYGNGRHLYLEFFSTEPLETLIKKRADFTARRQHRDPSKWYNGLLAEWNMDSRTLLGPENYDKITGWRIYEVTCDDPGLSKPAYLAAKNAEFPSQDEVEALDYYVKNFVWGGLQRTTSETYSYGIYGIPDWKTNRSSADGGTKGKLHIWRIYDYPHIVLMYFSLYKIAKNHPHISTVLTKDEYLRRAYGTALAMFTVPKDLADWSAYETGLYNELCIVDLIAELELAGLSDEADILRGHWEKKADFFINQSPNLFGSEYAFDSTGFESTHALAKYAFHRSAVAGSKKFTRQNVMKFMKTQIAANIFCRGWLEPAYYLLGSDYRGSAGNSYTLSYMAQMGGWAVLDFALNFAADPYPYLRLGYASSLSSWALVNSGTAELGYGYWYPGVENDGGAGGGFEPAPTGFTWLDQPHHRGSWYYSCEINLGFCGFLRGAATIIADDPIFGRFCYGGTWERGLKGISVLPKDGVRRRFHALLGAHRFSLMSEVDRFSATCPITLKEDLSEVRFCLETEGAETHEATLRILDAPSGEYKIMNGGKTLSRIIVTPGREVAFKVPMTARTSPEFMIRRSSPNVTR